MATSLHHFPNVHLAIAPDEVRWKRRPSCAPILPEGGGFLLTLPGVVDDHGYLGQGMFET